jgi:hypothetical protein
MRRTRLATVLLLLAALALALVPALADAQQAAPQGGAAPRAESPEAAADAAAGAGDRHSDPWGPLAALAIGVAVGIVLYTGYRRAITATRREPRAH